MAASRKPRVGVLKYFTRSVAQVAQRPNFGVKLPRPGFAPAAELPTSSPA